MRAHRSPVLLALALVAIAATADGAAVARRQLLADLSRDARPPRPGTAEEAAAAALPPARACALAKDCPTGCCLHGLCLPDAACRNALATLTPAQGAALNASCSASTYRQCTSGCCVGGRCAPHDVCWGALGTNHLARCEASTFEECDSGCCFEGRCHRSDACFPRGQGAPVGSACSSANATECASRCCSAAGQCADPTTCWPGLRLGSLRPSTSTPVSARQVGSCQNERPCRTSAGVGCPCDHTCVCGRCVPENSDVARRIGPALSNATQCASYDQAVSAMINTFPEADGDMIEKLFDQQDELRNKAVQDNKIDAAETCIYALGSAPFYKDCSGGKVCDPRTWTCVDRKDFDVTMKYVWDACPTGELYTETWEVDGAKFKSTLGWDLPKYSCVKCLRPWAADNSKSIIAFDCPQGTLCDVVGTESTVASGLCLPTTRDQDRALAQGSLPCSGTAQIGAQVASHAECSSCYWNSRAKTCIEAPPKFPEHIRDMAKGLASPLVDVSKPVRSDAELTGYPDYRSYPSKGSQLTYEYLSCLASRGTTADLRGDRYGNDFMLQSDAWYQRYTSTIWSKPASCNAACTVRSPTGQTVAPNVGGLGVATACQPYVDSIGQPLPDASGTVEKLGGAFDCSVYCHLVQEADWISNSAKPMIETNNVALVATFQKAKDALQAAQDLFKDAPLFVPKEEESTAKVFFTTLFSFIMEIVSIFFPEELIVEKLTEEFIEAAAKLIAKSVAAFIETSAAVIRYGGEVNEQVNPEIEITKAFGSAAGTDLKAEQLRDSFARSLDNTRLAFNVGVYSMIKDRAKLFYLSRLTDASGVNFDGQMQKAITDNLAPLDQGMKISFIKQLMVTKFDLCAVDETPDWPQPYPSLVCTKAFNDDDCPAWCEYLDAAEPDSFGKGQPEIKTRNAFFSWQTMGLRSPYLSAQGNDVPTRFGDVTYAKDMAMVRTRFWLCDKKSRAQTPDTVFWEQVLNCTWVGAEEAEDGEPAGRYLCEAGAGGAHVLDGPQMAFDASYWPNLENKPKRAGATALFGWPRLTVHDPTVGRQCVAYKSESSFPIG
ncbi:hypothetical protein DFJ74DRAFT_744628 [Hyaloraphidium curvatum]|nr:hypothetical protein DFJ74DRAFT_744628 [Hyaloraphidium curvatum]